MSGVVMGLDVGYSNIKIVYDERGQPPILKTLPASAAPVASLPQAMFGGDLKLGRRVLVGGNEHWAAGMAPTELQNYARVLHEHYPSSNEYEALVHLALLESGAEEVELLVTGLPVSQYLKPELRINLEKRLTGEHFVDTNTKVRVKRVKVLSQAVGAYVDALYSPVSRLAGNSDRYTLVLDAGYFSVDWVVLFRNNIRSNSSNSSVNATSVILEEAITYLEADSGVSISADRLEDCLRKDPIAAKVPKGREEISAMPAIEKAAKNAAAKVVVQVQSAMRTAGHGIDCIVLTGGGAKFYEKALREAFPKVPDASIYRSPDAIIANARGFYLAGRRDVDNVAAVA